MTRPLARSETGFLACVLLLFAALQLSNAAVDVHQAQHPGNFRDEALLTVELRDAESLTDAARSLHGGVPSEFWGYLLYDQLALETLGRRVVGVFLATLNLGYLGILLFRSRLLSRTGVVVCTTLFGTGAVTAMYAPMGLLPLNLLLLYSTLLLHLVLALHSRTPTWRTVGLCSLLFLVLAVHSIRSVVSICAVAGALAIGELLRRRSFRGAGATVFRYGTLLVPIIVWAVSWSTIAPHEELANPQRGFSLYFELSGFPQTFLGLLTFSAKRTFEVATSALELHPAILGSATASRWLAVAMLPFLLVGVVRSLARPREARFSVALGFVLTLFGHLLLSVATIVPYGNMRYLLPMACFFPVIAVLGMEDVSGALRRLFSLGGGTRSARGSGAVDGERGHRVPRPVPVSWIALLVLPAVSLWQVVPPNLDRSRAIRDGFDRYAREAATASTSLVMDDWTHVTSSDLHPDLVAATSYTLKTTLRTATRGKAPGEADSLPGWREFLSDQDHVYLVTSMAFTPRYYGNLFRVASKDFVVEHIVDRRAFSFTLLRRRTGDTPLIRGPVDLIADDWSRRRVSSIERVGEAYRVRLASKGSLIRTIPVSVAAGERLVVDAEIWAESETNVRLMIKRGDRGPYDGSVLHLSLDENPRRFSGLHAFKNEWTSVIVGWLAPDDREVTLYVRDLHLKIVAPTEEEEQPRAERAVAATHR